MNDLLIGYSVTLAFLAVVGALMCVYRYFLGNKLIEQSQKLKSQMAKLRQDFPELSEKRSNMVAGALGDIGIEGIMEELGIDPGLLANPLVKGLIDKYAPRLIEQLSKKTTGEKPETDKTWL
jgi:hypothetical protein